MTEPTEAVQEEAGEQAEKPAPAPRSAVADRKERDHLKLRERIARDAQNDVTDAFSAHADLRQSVQAAVQALDKAVQQCAALERKCSGGYGRRLFLGRRLFIKPTLVVLNAARQHLKRAVGQMDVASRQRDDLLEEATDPGLDH